MSPISVPVLAAAALVSAPALWSSLVERSMPVDTGLTRFLVSLFVCWVLFSIVATMIEMTPGKAAPAEGAAAGVPDAAGDGGPSGGTTSSGASPSGAASSPSGTDPAGDTQLLHPVGDSADRS